MNNTEKNTRPGPQSCTVVPRPPPWTTGCPTPHGPQLPTLTLYPAEMWSAHWERPCPHLPGHLSPRRVTPYPGGLAPLPHSLRSRAGERQGPGRGALRTHLLRAEPSTPTPSCPGGRRGSSQSPGQGLPWGLAAALCACGQKRGLGYHPSPRQPPACLWWDPIAPHVAPQRNDPQHRSRDRRDTREWTGQDTG